MSDLSPCCVGNLLYVDLFHKWDFCTETRFVCILVKNKQTPIIWPRWGMSESWVEKWDNQVQTLSCRWPFWLKSIRVSFLCKSCHLFERSINMGSHFLFLKGECQGHVLRAYIIVFIREFTTNSNKNIQFGVFALWKTTKEHIYWKDSKDIDGLENELQWTTSRPAVHYLNIHPLNNT